MDSPDACDTTPAVPAAVVAREAHEAEAEDLQVLCGGPLEVGLGLFKSAPHAGLPQLHPAETQNSRLEALPAPPPPPAGEESLHAPPPPLRLEPNADGLPHPEPYRHPYPGPGSQLLQPEPPVQQGPAQQQHNTLACQPGEPSTPALVAVAARGNNTLNLTKTAQHQHQHQQRHPLAATAFATTACHQPPAEADTSPSSATIAPAAAARLPPSWDSGGTLRAPPWRRGSAAVGAAAAAALAVLVSGVMPGSPSGLSWPAAAAAALLLVAAAAIGLRGLAAAEAGAGPTGSPCLAVEPQPAAAAPEPRDCLQVDAQLQQASSPLLQLPVQLPSPPSSPPQRLQQGPSGPAEAAAGPVPAVAPNEATDAKDTPVAAADSVARGLPRPPGHAVPSPDPLASLSPFTTSGAHCGLNGQPPLPQLQPQLAGGSGPMAGASDRSAAASRASEGAANGAGWPGGDRMDGGGRTSGGSGGGLLQKAWTWGLQGRRQGGGGGGGGTHEGLMVSAVARPSVTISIDGAEPEPGCQQAIGGAAAAAAAAGGGGALPPAMASMGSNGSVGSSDGDVGGGAATGAGGAHGGVPPAPPPHRLSYVSRLWRTALPGLHLLSRPQRQSEHWPGAAAAATPGGPSPYNANRTALRQAGWYGIAHGVVLGAASAASVLRDGAVGLAALTSRGSASGTQLPAAAGLYGAASGGLGAGHHKSSGGSVMNMVADLLPRVAGSWRMPRSASNSSLTALMEAAVAAVGSGGNGSGHPSGAAAVAGAGVGGGLGAMGGAAAAAGGWEPPVGANGGGGRNASAHAFLLSSADVAARKPAFSDLPQNAGRVQVLSVDDEPVNQQVMRALLWAAEYDVLEARSGEAALALIRGGEVLPDLVLLDVTLGGDVSGFEVCLEIRREYSPGELPVIMITCSSLEEDVIRGLAVGANDYLIKPLRKLELMARIKTQLALKRSIRVAAEARVNRSLLGSILPANVIRQLKAGVTLIAQFHQEVTILFSDIRGFTNLATEWPTEQIILMLNNMFTAFDRLCDQIGVYKVETIGDAYMIVSGHDGVEDHAARMLRMATRMLEAVEDMRGFDGRELQIRVGIHTGPAHSGVVGLSRPRYCFFGDTVNTASRMESTGFPMAVQVSESTLRAVTSRPEWASEFQFAPCGPRDIKGKGVMHTFLLRTGLYDKALAELAAAAAAAATAGPRRRAAVAALAATAAGATDAAPASASAAAATTAEDTPEAPVAAAAAPPPPPPPSQDDARTAAQPTPSKPSASGAGSAGAAGSVTAPAVPPTVASHWRSQIAAAPVATGAAMASTSASATPSATPSAAEPGLSEFVDHVKYASYRYHHQQFSGADVVSSAGTNVLMDNGLALLLPSHVMDGALVDTLDALPSGIARLAHANASNGGGGGHAADVVGSGGGGAAGGAGGASRAIPGFSASIPLAHPPPASPTRRLAAIPGGWFAGGQKTAYGTSGSSAATAAAATATSARHSLDLSGRGGGAASATGLWGVASTSAGASAAAATGGGDTGSAAVGIASRTGSSAIAAADGAASLHDGRAPPPPAVPPPVWMQRSRPPSPLRSSQSPGGGLAPSSRTTSLEASADEPSLAHGVSPGAGGGAGTGASYTTRALTGRHLTAAQLRRSMGRTSEELTVAAADAAVAGAASNCSGNDELAIIRASATSAASAVTPDLGLDFEALILAQRSWHGDARSEMGASGRTGAAAAGASGGAGSGPAEEGPLPGHMLAGWALVVDGLEPTAAAAAAAASVAASAAATMGGSSVSHQTTGDMSQTLGGWAQTSGGGAVADGHASPLPLAGPTLQRLGSRPILEATEVGAAAAAAAAGGRAAADSALVPEPTLAVAAEALAAAVDSVLNSYTGDLFNEIAAVRRDGGTGGSLQATTSAPAPMANRAAAAFSPDGGGRGGRVGPSNLSPAVVQSGAPPPRLLQRTASNGNMGRSSAASASAAELQQQRQQQPMLHERAATVPRAGALAYGGAAFDGGGARIAGGGGGGAGVEADRGQHRFAAIPAGSVGIGAGAASGSVNVSHSGSAGGVDGGGGGSIYSPRDAYGGGREPWARHHVGRRPATATGASAAGPSKPYNTAQFLNRETIPPLAFSGNGAVDEPVATPPAPAATGGGGISSGGGSGGGSGSNGGAWSALVQRSGLYSAGNGSNRRRPATAHGSTTVATHGWSGPSPAALVFRQHHAASAVAAGEGAPGGAAAAAVGFTGAGGPGEDMPYGSWAFGTSSAQQDSGASSRGANGSKGMRAHSRKSFSCVSANGRHHLHHHHHGLGPGPGGGSAGAGGGGASFGGNNSGHPHHPAGSHATTSAHGGVPATLLASGGAGSMGGVSIISQGWSNLYDPLCPRPRLTDHYASGDLEDLAGSAGVRTPGSVLSPSICSGQPWDYSAQPSPTLLTPAHSTHVPTSVAAAAAAASAADVATAAAAAAAVRNGAGRVSPAARPGPTQAAAAGDGRLGGGAGGGGGDGSSNVPFDPVFGEMSGVTSGHDMMYGIGDGHGDAVEAEMAAAATAHSRPNTHPVKPMASLHSQALATAAQRLERSRSLDVGRHAGPGGVGGPAAAPMAGGIVASDSAYGNVYGNGLYSPVSGETVKVTGLPAAAPLPYRGPEQGMQCPPTAGAAAGAAEGAAAAAAAGAPDVNAALLQSLAALAANHGGGGVRAGSEPQRVGGSPNQMSPTAAKAGAGAAKLPWLPTNGAVVPSYHAVPSPYHRRHSDDVVRRPAITAAAASPAAAAAVAAAGGDGGGGVAARSPTAPNRWYHPAPDSTHAGGGAPRPPAPSRASADLPRRLGPGPFGSPIGALGPAAAAAAAAAAGQADGGGLDIARMLARASELVVMSPSNSSGGAAGDGGAAAVTGGASSSSYAAVSVPWSPRPSVDIGTLQGPEPVTDAGFAAGAAGSPTFAAAAAAAAVAAWPADAQVAHRPRATAEATPGAVGPSSYELPFNSSSYQPPYQPSYHHNHHHAVHVTRLDPVDEGCGSSAAQSASSSSYAGCSGVQTAVAGAAGADAAAAAAGGGGGATAAPAGARAAASATQRHSADCHPQPSRLLTLNGAAAAAASLSNSGPGNHRGGGGGNASASSASTSPAVTPQHARTASARWDAAAAAAAAFGLATAGSANGADAVTAVPAVPRPPPPASKRAFTSMLKKVKKALRAGGSSGSGGSGGGADLRQ